MGGSLSSAYRDFSLCLGRYHSLCANKNVSFVSNKNVSLRAHDYI